MLLTQLDMPVARYISYRIDVRKANGNISSLSIAKAYRVNEVDISKEEKARARIEGLILLSLLFSACNMGLGLAHLHLSRQMLCSHLAKFSNSPIRTSPIRVCAFLPLTKITAESDQTVALGVFHLSIQCSAYISSKLSSSFSRRQASA